MTPIWIDVFLAVIRDNDIAQVSIMAVFLLICLDCIFGVGNALLHKEFSSRKMREGIAHKCSELGFALVGLVVDGAALGGLDLGYGAPCFTAICVGICIIEIGSLLEIFSLMNPDLASSPVFRLLAQNPNGDEVEEDE